MGAQNTNCTMKFIDIPEERQREAINTGHCRLDCRRQVSKRTGG